MKKISRTIAMILVLIMLACSFTSCFSSLVISSGKYGWLFLTVPVDIVLILLAIVLRIDIFADAEMESQIYMASAEYNPFTEYYSLREKVYSLPEAELSSLKQAVNSIPETEYISSIEKITSLSETQHISFVSAYNSLPEREFVSSIKRINSLHKAELVSLLRTFNSLSEAELDSLIKELQSLRETEYVASADYLREKAYMGLRF